MAVRRLRRGRTALASGARGAGGRRARGEKGDRGKRLGFGGGRGYVGRERWRMAATAPAGAVSHVGHSHRTVNMSEAGSPLVGRPGRLRRLDQEAQWGGGLSFSLFFYLFISSLLFF